MRAPFAPDAVDLATAAPMDLRLDARAVLFRSSARTLKLGAEAALFVPTGNADSYGGDGSASWRSSASRSSTTAPPSSSRHRACSSAPPAPCNDFKVGSEWRYRRSARSCPCATDRPPRRAALRLHRHHERHDLHRREHAARVAGRRAAATRREPPRGYSAPAAAHASPRATRPTSARCGSPATAFGIEDTDRARPEALPTERDGPRGADTDKDGFPDDIDLCPTEPEDDKPPNPDDGCPALPDRDGDGIPDISDKCPDQPEDFDRIQDADGCPEDDADKDGIADAEDACPKEPGEPSPEPEKNGCPQFIRRISGIDEIEISKQVEFETGRATHPPDAAIPILDEVVRC